MKLYSKIILCFALAITFTSCEDFVGGDINADPNSPTAVPVNAQLPSIQINIADVYGGAFSRFNSLLTQQVEGVARQWSSFNQYTGLTPNRFDSAWTNVYEAILNEIALAKTSAGGSGFNHYVALLETLEAFTLMTAADVWDDIPYTEALQGIDITSPNFDSQASIYAAAYALLTSAESKFNGDSGSVSPASDDVFYGGNVNNWLKAINAIRARGLLHEGKYAEAMSAAMNSFESAADNLAYQYPDANAAGQWYRFNRDRTGDLEFHPTMRGMMQGLNDTMRLAMYDQTFNPDHGYMIPNFLQEMVTYREMQFIIAECGMRTSSGDITTAYTNGITASFDRAGVSGAAADYIAQSEVSGNIDMNAIMTQKYLGLYLQPEVYSDWRRTNIPSLSPVSGNAIPVRWDYSSNEYLFNANLDEGAVDIFTDRVGWNR